MTNPKDNKEEKIETTAQIGCSYSAGCCPGINTDPTNNCYGMFTRLSNGRILIDCAKC